MNNDTPADAITQVEGGTDDVFDVLVDAQRALKVQEGAEIWNSNCVECEGSGDWAECSICADAFGKAIDARNSVMPLIDTTLARHRTTSLAAQDGLVDALRDLKFICGLERRTKAGESVMVNINVLRKLDAALASIEVKS